MKKTKFRFFTIAQWREEENYLRRQHRKGWRLQKVRYGVLYDFEPCPPEDVIYQLDYNETIDNKQDYIRMFHDCGWEYIQDLMGYSYFRKPVKDMQSGDEAIFSDDTSRLEMMKRVIRGRVLPLTVLVLLVTLPQLLRDTPQSQALRSFWIILFTVYVVVTVNFLHNYFQLKRQIEKRS